MDVVIGVMWASLGILVLVILYRLLLRKLSAGRIDKRDFCELYDVETNPIKGEVKFYFTSEMVREVKFIIYDQKMDPLKIVKDFECNEGGNIIHFNSSELADGNYFYGLETENQKIMKKMRINNAVV